MDLGPDDERLKRSRRLLADGQWRQLRGDKGLEEVVRQLASPAYADRFAPVIPNSARRWPRSAGSSASSSRRHRPREWPGGPSIPGRDALLLDLDRELSQAGLVGDDELEQFLDGGDQEQDGDPEG